MKKKTLWLIYLAVAIFIAIYFIKISPSKEKEDINAEAPFGLYKDMITMIRRENYIFDYNILNGDMNIKYSGKKDGSKEESKILYNEEENKDNLLDEYIDVNLLNPNYLFDKLESKDYELTNENEKRIFKYETKINDNNFIITVETSLDSITQIIIISNDVICNLKYENIGFTTIN